MRRIELFTIRVSAMERQMIAQLADRLQRSQSDAVRLLIRQAARRRGLLPAVSQQQPNKPDSGGEANGQEGGERHG